MDYFQVSVKEKTRKFMFTVIGQKRKKMRKARITTAAATTVTLKLVVMIKNRSFKSYFDFASHWLSIKLQIYCLTRSLCKEQREEKQ